VNILIDTSALLAVLDRSDERHSEARRVWEDMLKGNTILVCHNYVLVETSTVLTRRLGMDAVRTFVHDVIPVLRVVWVTRDVHEAAVASHMAAERRALSLVDCASFEIMRRTGVRTAFAFDPHFGEFGYETVPTPR